MWCSADSSSWCSDGRSAAAAGAFASTWLLAGRSRLRRGPSSAAIWMLGFFVGGFIALMGLYLGPELGEDHDRIAHRSARGACPRRRVGLRAGWPSRLRHRGAAHAARGENVGAHHGAPERPAHGCRANLPHCRSIRLQTFDYSSPGAYFVTIVTQGSAALFGAVVDGEMRLMPPARWCGCDVACPSRRISRMEVGAFDRHAQPFPRDRHPPRKRRGGLAALGARSCAHGTGPRQRAGTSCAPTAADVGCIVGAFKSLRVMRHTSAA